MTGKSQPAYKQIKKYKTFKKMLGKNKAGPSGFI